MICINVYTFYNKTQNISRLGTSSKYHFEWIYCKIILVKDTLSSSSRSSCQSSQWRMFYVLFHDLTNTEIIDFEFPHHLSPINRRKLQLIRSRNNFYLILVRNSCFTSSKSIIIMNLLLEAFWWWPYNSNFPFKSIFFWVKSKSKRIIQINDWSIYFGLFVGLSYKVLESNLQ